MHRTTMNLVLGSATIAMLCGLRPAHGQSLTYGLVAGTALTNDFSTRTFPFINPVTGNPQSFIETPASRGFIVGGLLKLYFTPGASVEGDFLFRELHFNETQTGPRDAVVTWELPVLWKYQFRPAGKFSPFIAVGPNFRTTGNLNATNPSHRGISVGAGLRIRFGFLDVIPTLRYTRWGADQPALYLSKPDQLEFLVQFTRRSKL